MEIRNVKVGEVVSIEWSSEAVRVTHQSPTCTRIESLKSVEGVLEPERSIAGGCPVVPYEGRLIEGLCACGCGLPVTGLRRGSLYASTTCRSRVFRRKADATDNRGD